MPGFCHTINTTATSNSTDKEVRPSSSTHPPQIYQWLFPPIVMPCYHTHSRLLGSNLSLWIPLGSFLSIQSVTTIGGSLNISRLLMSLRLCSCSPTNIRPSEKKQEFEVLLFGVCLFFSIAIWEALTQVETQVEFWLRGEGNYTNRRNVYGR